MHLWFGNSPGSTSFSESYPSIFVSLYIEMRSYHRLLQPLPISILSCTYSLSSAAFLSFSLPQTPLLQKGLCSFLCRQRSLSLSLYTSHLGRLVSCFGLSKRKASSFRWRRPLMIWPASLLAFRPAYFLASYIRYPPPIRPCIRYVMSFILAYCRHAVVVIVVLLFTWSQRCFLSYSLLEGTISKTCR